MVKDSNMLHTMTLISFGEEWHIKTAHHIDMDTKRVFEDILSFRNFHHWDEMDLENFLVTKGRLVSECIPQLELDDNDTIPAVLASEKFKNIEKIIVCVYPHIEMESTGRIFDYWGNIPDQVDAATPPDVSGFFAACICDEQKDQKSTDEQKDQKIFTVNLIAICSEPAI
jgi:hypothetical protein